MKPYNLNEILDTDWLCCTDDDGETYKVRGSKFKNLFVPPLPDILGFTPPTYPQVCHDDLFYLVGDTIGVNTSFPIDTSYYTCQWYVYDYFSPDGVKEIKGEGISYTFQLEDAKGRDTNFRVLDKNGVKVFDQLAWRGDRVAVNVLESLDADVYVCPDDPNNPYNWYIKAIFKDLKWGPGVQKLIPVYGNESVWVTQKELGSLYVTKHSFYAGSDDYATHPRVYKPNDPEDELNVILYFSIDGGGTGALTTIDCIALKMKDCIVVNDPSQFPPQLTV